MNFDFLTFFISIIKFIIILTYLNLDNIINLYNQFDISFYISFNFESF